MEFLIPIVLVVIVMLWGFNAINKFNKFVKYHTTVLEKDIENINKDILSMRPASYERAMDMRGTPTHLCPCGSMIWSLKVIFDDYQIATYFLDMECVNCGSVATAPTPLDRMGI